MKHETLETLLAQICGLGARSLSIRARPWDNDQPDSVIDVLDKDGVPVAIVSLIPSQKGPDGPFTLAMVANPSDQTAAPRHEAKIQVKAADAAAFQAAILAALVKTAPACQFPLKDVYAALRKEVSTRNRIEDGARALATAAAAELCNAFHALRQKEIEDSIGRIRQEMLFLRSRGVHFDEVQQTWDMIDVRAVMEA